MKHPARKIIHAMMVFILVVAPVQFSGAAMHMDCALATDGAMVTTGSADASGDMGSTMDHDEGSCLGMTHGCVSCVSCFAVSAFPVAAACSGEAPRPLREQRPASADPAPSFRPPIVLQS